MASTFLPKFVYCFNAVGSQYLLRNVKIKFAAASRNSYKTRSFYVTLFFFGYRRLTRLMLCHCPIVTEDLSKYQFLLPTRFATIYFPGNNPGTSNDAQTNAVNRAAKSRSIFQHFVQKRGPLIKRVSSDADKPAIVLMRFATTLYVSTLFLGEGEF